MQVVPNKFYAFKGPRDKRGLSKTDHYALLPSDYIRVWPYPRVVRHLPENQGHFVALIVLYVPWSEFGTYKRVKTRIWLWRDRCGLSKTDHYVLLPSDYIRV